MVGRLINQLVRRYVMYTSTFEADSTKLFSNHIGECSLHRHRNLRRSKEGGACSTSGYCLLIFNCIWVIQADFKRSILDKQSWSQLYHCFYSLLWFWLTILTFLFFTNVNESVMSCLVHVHQSLMDFRIDWFLYCPKKVFVLLYHLKIIIIVKRYVNRIDDNFRYID